MIKRISFIPLALASSILILSLGNAAAQDEPAGAPGSAATRMKNLNQIEPRTLISSIPYNITNSGSYYFTQNLTGDTNITNGITIAANDVTLDMCGFVLTGTSNGFSGINVTGAQNRNITIKNGVVRGWGQAGLYLQNGMSCRLTGVTAIDNGSSPAYAAIYVGEDWDVDDCSASFNRNCGISIGNNSRARNCKARGNMTYGFMIGNGCRVENCTAYANHQDGFSGGMMSMIMTCFANNNTNNGINVGLYSMASGNIASYNGGDGICAGTGSRIEKNLSTQNNGRGIIADAYSRVTENQIVQNTGPNIYGKVGCRVDNNHIFGGYVGIQSDSYANGSLFVANSVIGCTSNFITTSSANFGQIIGSSYFAGMNTNFVVNNPWVNFDLQP